MRTFLLLFSFLSAPAFAVTPECLNQMGQAFNAVNEQQAAHYLEVDSETGQIREGNESRFLPGSNDDAYIVIHGFAASPFEVEALGKALQQTGATVYMPLLPGFGSSVRVANRYMRQSWRDTLNYSVEIFSRCFKEISLAGFSTGGTTVTDFLLNDKDVSNIGVYKNKVWIKKAVLMSPYLKSNSVFANLLNRFISFFSESASIEFLYQVSGNPDLQTFFINPKYYNDAIPLESAKQVVRFGRELRQKAEDNAPVSSVPVFVAYSHSDQTIETDHLEEFYSTHFKHAAFDSYPEEQKVPHQIGVTNINPDADNLNRTIVSFFSTNQ